MEYIIFNFLLSVFFLNVAARRFGNLLWSTYFSQTLGESMRKKGDGEIMTCLETPSQVTLACLLIPSVPGKERRHP